jgi:hypothetical protein
MYLPVNAGFLYDKARALGDAIKKHYVILSLLIQEDVSPGLYTLTACRARVLNVGIISMLPVLSTMATIVTANTTLFTCTVYYL